MSKYIIQVAPIIPLPVLRTQVFSYWYPEELPVGSLVSAPFYFREIRGIVIGSRRDTLPENSPKLKNINYAIEENFLSENQIKLARRIAEYYFAPLGSVLKLMVPKAAGQRMKKAEKAGLPATRSLAGRAGAIASKIANSRKNKFLLISDPVSGEEASLDLIGKYLKNGKQCLILAPEIFFSHSLFEKMRAFFGEGIALVHSRITKGQFYDQWKRIKAGETKIVIASKQGIFLPFADLGIIIVREAQDVSFKQWEAMPRYNAVRGAEFLADISGARLVLESSAPSVESFWRAQKKELELIGAKWRSDLKNRDPISKFPKIETISPDKAVSSTTSVAKVTTRRGSGNPDFPISKVLYGYLAEAVKNKKQAVVFVNRRGFSTRSICENCKKILKCPKCGPALAYSDEAGVYRCLHCAYKKDILSACPACGGFQFSHRGIGTQTVEKKIAKLFPSARVARIDADMMRSSVKYKNILQKFSSGEIDVLVGTQSAIKGAYSGKIGLAAAISGRDFADGVEFGSREMALSRIFNMANLAGGNGRVAIQAFFGGNPLIDVYNNRDLKKYFEQELATRKRFSYPPFRKFMKLTYGDKSEKNAANIAKKTFDLLQRAGNNKVEVIGPYEPLSEQKRGLYQQNILIKFDLAKNIRDLPIRAVLGGLRKDWSVDVDPVILF